MADISSNPPPAAGEPPPPLPVPDAELAVLYLRGRDAACAHCRYSLRNATTHVCPECGRPNSIAELVTGASRSPTRSAWTLTLALAGASVLLHLTIALLGAGLATALVLPLIERGQLPWIVGGVIVVASTAAWLGVLYLLAKWIRLPGDLFRRLRSGPGRRRGRAIASFTSPRWMRKFILPLAILLALLYGWSGATVIYYSVSSMASFASIAGGRAMIAASLINCGMYVLVFGFSLAAAVSHIVRLRRGDDPLRDGVVIGWLLLSLAAAPLSYALQFVLMFVL